MRFHHAAIAVGLFSAALVIGSAAAGEDREEQEQDRAHQEHRGRRGAAGGGGEGEGGGIATSPDPLYVKECGACHVAYPPAFLPAGSWRRLLAGLDRHFGQDAALDEVTRARLERWVLQHAAPDRPRGEAPLRVSEQAWFRGEHREVPRAAVARPPVGSMANCTACHAGAPRWDFEEDQVRIPAG